jgi:O-antigen/teichoic acid export membrane protein
MIKKFISLFLSFSVINILNRLIPLFTVPILTNKLGLEGYGLYLIILTYTVLFDTLISFGFKTTAVIELNFCKDSEQENELFFRVLFSKLLVTFPLIIILFCVLIQYEIDVYYLFVFCLFMLLGAALNQEWYFHGKKKMKTVLSINFPIRILYLVLIYFFIRNVNDLKFALIFFSVTFFLQSFIGLIMAVSLFKLILPKSFKLKTIVTQYKNSGYFFLSKLSSYFYTSFNFIILDNFYSPAIIGVYGIADKLVNVVRDFSNIFNNSILPLLAEKQKINKNQINIIFLIYLVSVFLIFSFVSMGISFFSNDLFLFFNSETDHLLLGSKLIKILALSIPITVVTGSLSQMYLIKSQSKKLFWITSIFALISLITLYITASNYELITFGYAYVILMLVLFSLSLINIKK